MRLTYGSFGLPENTKIRIQVVKIIPKSLFGENEPDSVVEFSDGYSIIEGDFAPYFGEDNRYRDAIIDEDVKLHSIIETSDWEKDCYGLSITINSVDKVESCSSRISHASVFVRLRELEWNNRAVCIVDRDSCNPTLKLVLWLITKSSDDIFRTVMEMVVLKTRDLENLEIY